MMSRDGGTMGINARVISGLDPGAIPGGSTNTLLRVIGGWRTRCFLGADQHRRTSKGVGFLPVWASAIGLFSTANDNFAEEYALAA